MKSIKLSFSEQRDYQEIPVLYEDEHLMALDKPADLPFAQDPLDPSRPNLVALLHQGIKEAKPWAVERKLDYLMNAHGADPDSSGIVLLARSREVLSGLVNLFNAEKPWRQYLALVRTDPLEKEFELNAKLASDGRRPGMMRVDGRSGKRARTKVEVLETFSGFALLRCFPLTNRTHQVRVHLRYAGFPVVADQLYGEKPLLLSRLKESYRLKPGQTERPLLARAALHAEVFTFPHPVTNEVLTVQAPWPKDITVAVKYLHRFASGWAEPEPAGSELENSP
jgi:RluA family pseudouridine synthase